MGKRETWKSSLGFTLAAAGSAVGLANIWKFSYVVGEYGGASFLAVYFMCLLVIGIPVLYAELMLGRKAQCSAVLAYPKLSPRWGQCVGFWTFLTALLVSGFYAAVAGWVVGYACDAVQMLWSQQRIFTSLASLTDSAVLTTSFHGSFIVVCTLVVCLGVQKGVERASLFGMPLLLLLLFCTMFWSLLQEGAMNGLSYLFTPNWDVLTPQALLTALGHAFFTLSLGQGTMLTYGSYVSKDMPIKTSLMRIVALDTVISLMAAVMIFACAGAVGVQPDSGPSLLFETLPRVFDALPFGSLFCFFFFTLVSLAAVTSEISVMEILAAYFVEHLRISRRQAGCLAGLLSFSIGLPAAWSTNLLQDVTIFSRQLLDVMDWVATSVLIPVGGFCAITMFVVTEGVKVDFQTQGFMQAIKYSVFKFVAPLGIVVIFMANFFMN